MKLKIDKIDILLFNWQYQKEIHNKEGKPNQKCGCVFHSAKILDYELKDYVKLKDFTVIKTKSNLNFNKEKLELIGKLPIDLSKPDKFQQKVKFSMFMKIELDKKKIFNKLYEGETIKIIFGPEAADILSKKEIDTLPEGKIKFIFTFSDTSGTKCIPFFKKPPTLDEKGIPLFEYNLGYEIFNLELDSIIDKIEVKNKYVVKKEDFEFKYKIDVHNYLWIKGSCDYKETDDTNIVNFDFKFPKELKFKDFKKDLIISINSEKELIYNIIKNHSLEDKFCKDPFKECLDGKGWVLDEELPVSIKYKEVKNKYN